MQETIRSSRHPDIIEIRKARGCTRIFGIPFFLAGLFIIQIPFGIIPVNIDNEPLIFSLVFPLGVAFAIVGCLLMFSNHGIIIDRSQGIVITWWGLLIPMKRKTYPLTLFDRITIHAHHGDHDAEERYSLTFVGSLHTESLTLMEHSTYKEIYTAGERLSQFLHKPVKDMTRTGD